MRAAVITILLLVNAFVAEAHVTVWPQESSAGAGERYTVRVPTEGNVETTSVELEVPADVRVTSILVGGGYTYEARREGDRIVAITWKQEIRPGEVAEFVFFARNPRDGKQIAWKTHQHFADGTTTDWVGVGDDRAPASLTQLTAAR